MERQPEEIRSDNSGIAHLRIQKGKPTQNGFIERFNRTYREDVWDANIFENIGQVRELSEQWKGNYNEKHPHSSLGNMSPNEFLKAKANKKLPILAL